MRTQSPITVLAGADIEPNRRIRHNGTSWVHADKNDVHDAVSGDARIPSGKYGAAYAVNDAGLIDIEAATTLTLGNTCYGADAGKVSSTVDGIKVGKVLVAPLAASNPASVLMQPRNISQASFAYPASPVDTPFFIAPRALRVRSINFRPLVTAASATAVVKKAPSGTAVASGTALHSNNFTLDGTTNVNQAGTLSVTSTDLLLAAGDALGVDFTGTTTNGTGVVTVEFEDQ